MLTGIEMNHQSYLFKSDKLRNLVELGDFTLNLHFPDVNRCVMRWVSKWISWILMEKHRHIEGTDIYEGVKLGAAPF